MCSNVATPVTQTTTLLTEMNKARPKLVLPWQNIQIKLLMIIFTMTSFAHAQDIAGFNAWSDSQYNYLSSEVMKNTAIQNYASGERSRYRNENGYRQPGRYTETSYIPNQRIEREVKDIIAQITLPSARDPATLQRLIDTGNTELYFDQFMQKHGLQSGDLADAMAGYWLTLWTVANRRPMPSRTAVAGVREQMAQGLSFERSIESPAARQREAQLLMWQMFLVTASTTRNDISQIELSNEMYQSGLRKGFDLRRLRPSASGFVMR
jgi:hypothetical protein